MSKRVRLLGRRLRGDLGPTQLDSRTTLPGRDLSGAVSLTGVDQHYVEQSVNQNFTIGSRMVVQDRSFYYSKAIAALAYPTQFRLCVSTDQILANNDRASNLATTATGRTIRCDVAAGPAFQAGVVAADELIGGYVEVNSAGQYAWRKITANTAVAGGNITITVDEPWGVVFPVPSLVTIDPSIYRSINTAAAAGLPGFAAAVGLPPIEVTINRYFWLQTYGPCFIGPTGAFPLSVANDYDVYYHSDGTTNSANGEGIAGGGNVSIQRIGHVMGSGAYGAGSVFLELAK